MTNEIPQLTLNNGAMDTGTTLLFDHRDPDMVSWLNSRAD